MARETFTGRRSILKLGNNVRRCRFEHGEISQQELANAVGVTRLARYLRLSAPFVAIEVARLVKTGLLRKRADSSDGRRIRLNVTPKGRQLLASLAPDQARVNDIIFQNLTTQEFRELRRLLGKLAFGAERGIALLDYLVGERELRAAV